MNFSSAQLTDASAPGSHTPRQGWSSERVAWTGADGARIVAVSPADPPSRVAKARASSKAAGASPPLPLPSPSLPARFLPATHAADPPPDNPADAGSWRRDGKGSRAAAWMALLLPSRGAGSYAPLRRREARERRGKASPTPPLRLPPSASLLSSTREMIPRVSATR